jgi:hypothetical protein
MTQILTALIPTSLTTSSNSRTFLLWMLLFPFLFAKTGTAQFTNWCIAGSVTQATRCLVLQLLCQTPVSLYLDTSSKLPPHSIHLFLHIAFMLMTTGQMQHDALSSILVLVFSLISPDYKEWPSMPSSTASFQSHMLNPTNQHSLVSILPIPHVYLLHDQSHAYCCLREIAAYVLLLPRSTCAPPVPLRLTQLCQSAMMQNFLSTAPPIGTTKYLVLLGLVFWLDAWVGSKCLFKKQSIACSHRICNMRLSKKRRRAHD